MTSPRSTPLLARPPLRRRLALACVAGAAATILGAPSAPSVALSPTTDARPAEARTVIGQTDRLTTSSPRPDADGGDPGVGFSPGFSIMYQPTPELRRDLKGMYDLGARRLRIDLSWALAEPRRGEWDWSVSDRVIREARAAGLNVLAIVGYEPGWAATGRSVSPRLFANFVDRASKRYARSVRAWEIWNEPNLERFWRPRPAPEAYADVVAAAAPMIRRNDPRAPILVGSLAPATDTGSELSPETFLRRFYRAIPRHQVFDGISVHPYCYPAMPAGREEWNTFFRLDQIRDVAVRAGDRDVRVWLTEYGAPTGRSDRSVPTRVQAAMLAEAVKEARRLRWVGPLFLYSYRDVDDNVTDPESNFGIVHHDGVAKPAFWTLRRALRG